MTRDVLGPAHEAWTSGQPARAIDLAWRDVRPAVLAQDAQVLSDAVRLAEDIAGHTEGDVRRDAEQLATYCAGCLVEPHDAFPFSMKGLFSRRSRRTKRCPDCAEEIQSDARLCRFCGYRYPQPHV